jgi:hypothetical protein
MADTHDGQRSSIVLVGDVYWKQWLKSIGAKPLSTRIKWSIKDTKMEVTFIAEKGNK